MLIKLLMKLKQRLFYFIKDKYDLDNSHIFMKMFYIFFSFASVLSWSEATCIGIGRNGEINDQHRD